MRPPDRGCAAERRYFVIIKKDIGLKEFNALVNFINGPDSFFTEEEAGGMILSKDTLVKTSHRRVLRFKGNIQVAENGDGFGVTIELDERVSVERLMGTNNVDVPPRFLANLLKALGSPLE